MSRTAEGLTLKCSECAEEFDDAAVLNAHCVKDHGRGALKSERTPVQL
jgi:hypothetical protein